VILDPVSSVLTDPRFPTLAVWISATPVESGDLAACIICRNNRGEVLFCSPAIPVPKPVTGERFYREPESITPKRKRAAKKSKKRSKRKGGAK